MHTRPIIVANWKMYFTYNQVISFLQQHHSALENLTQNAIIVLCPSFEAVALLKDYSSKNVYIGTQDVSLHNAGAYTGEVCAQSLKEIGCSYSIVGHSERRSLLGETNDIIAQKVIRSFENSLTPIVCIGETAEEYAAGGTIEVLKRQLEPIITVSTQKRSANLCIAYEPVWAIGTGKTPSVHSLEKIFSCLKKIVYEQLANANITLLYGGSVNEHNAQELSFIEHIQGFLVGNASTDFKKFEKIVSLVCNKK